MSQPAPGPGPDFDSLKPLLLALAQQRDAGEALQAVTREMSRRPHMGLFRVWLIQPGDVCDSCALRARCADRSACLHLAHSGGRSISSPAADWSRLDGPGRRIPLGAGEVGRTAVDGENREIPQLRESPDLTDDAGFAAREGIRGACLVPIVYQGNVLGVAAAWLRHPPLPEGTVWFRLIADHLGAALVNARAFERLERALAENERLRAELALENEILREEIAGEGSFGEIVGQSPALARIVRQIDLVAPTDAGVLILGESGVGKELIAREIHRRSRRSAGPLIRVNCAAIPAELFESEFFGHLRGAFTGAVRDRAGRFEAADRGTLFLDEVGEIPLALQGKLLRVLQEGTFERVGEERTRRVDVRVLAATNRDLEREVEAGRFRQDLFYRLNVFPLEVPPLRERPEDVAPLARRFLAESARRLGRPALRLTEAALRDLLAYHWPGNVRELAHVIERAVITAEDGRLRFHLAGRPAAPPAREERAPEADRILTESEMRALERHNLQRALEKTRGKVFGPGGAAELLGVPPTTLATRLKALGLGRPGRGT